MCKNAQKHTVKELVNRICRFLFFWQYSKRLNISIMMPPPLAADDASPLALRNDVASLRAAMMRCFPHVPAGTHHCRRQHHVQSTHHLPDRANIIQKNAFCLPTKGVFLLVTHTGIEPMFPPWEGGVLAAWPMGRFARQYHIKLFLFCQEMGGIFLAEPERRRIKESKVQTKP